MSKIYYKKRLEPGYKCRECGAESETEVGIKSHTKQTHEYNGNHVDNS